MWQRESESPDVTSSQHKGWQGGFPLAENDAPGKKKDLKEEKIPIISLPPSFGEQIWILMSDKMPNDLLKAEQPPYS